MVILGVILLVLALLVTSLHFLLWIGVALIIIGLILNFVPLGSDRTTRRRRIY
jgi:membrane protein implicated in regulation of membrane protease activity